MIDIQRFHISLHPITVRERAAGIASRLREVVAGPLAQALQGLDGAALGVEDDALVFIDRLPVELGLSTVWPDAVLARQFATRLGRQLATTLHEGGTGVRHFASRAAWLAEYLIARAGGHGAAHWWFNALDGLRLVPTPAALRSVLCGNGEDGIKAVALLHDAASARVITALGVIEQRRVLMLWSDREGSSVPAMATLLRVVERAVTGMADGSDADRLVAAVALARVQPEAINRVGMARLAAVSALMHWAVAADPSGAEQPNAGLGDMCAAAGLGAAALVGLDTAERDALEQALRDTMASRRAAAGEPAPAGPAGRMKPGDVRGEGAASREQARTPHGGAFVLATVLMWRDALVVAEQVLDKRPEVADEAAMLARAIALSVIARALQGGSRAAVLNDPALAQAFAVPDAAGLLRRFPGATRAVLGAWKCTLPTSAGSAGGLLAALAARVPGCAGASPAWLRSQLLACSASLSFDPAAGTLDVRLSRAPLHVLLLIAGLAHGSWRLGSWWVRVQTEDLA